MKKYLIRLDDACPTMDKDKWRRVESILDKFAVKPMVGVIPANADPKQKIESPDPLFWEKVKNWEGKGWSIALHGYDHCYTSNDAGINPLWKRSEFAGLTLREQIDKIKKGVQIFKSHGIYPKYFFAPSHTFDKNTLEALREGSDIRIISDTIATKPYTQYGFSFIPQMGGMPRAIKLPGIWTFCLHPSTMTDMHFEILELFLYRHHNECGCFADLNLKNLKCKDLFSRLISWMYFCVRKLKGIR